MQFFKIFPRSLINAIRNTIYAIRDKWTTVLFIGAIVFLLLAKVTLEKKMELAEIPATGKIVYWLAESHPEEAVLAGAAVSLGFKEVISDLFFLQSIQYFGTLTESKESRFKKTYPILRAMGTVSPHFIAGYSFGALVMEETGYINEAIAFLDEGIKNNPYAFELWLYRDFIIRLFKTQEYKRAIEGLKQAIRLEGHPPILERILAFAYEKDGQLKRSILQWRGVFIKTSSSEIREIARRNIERILKLLIDKEGKEKALCWFQKAIEIEKISIQ